MLLSRLSIIACLALAAAGVRAEAPFAFETTPGRLPKDVVPIDYDVQLAPDLAALRFRGRAAIRIEVRRATSRIVLNALQLEIDSARLSGPGRRSQALVPRLDADAQTLRFDLARPLAPGRYRLVIAWRGVLQRQPQGLYYDRYTTPAGETKTLLGTELEPTDARRVLPLWDEPSFRAVFRLTADLPRTMRAYSNTPIVSEQPLGGGLKRVRFGATPRMASYLLALVAGDLERRAVKVDGVETGIVTTEGKLATAAVALDEGVRLLHYYDGYFGIPYPLPKLDHIATPGGFTGAMENWGAIVYNESNLLFDPALQPESAQRRVTAIMAHEMAHQWFGNLVTMAWWDNLWLNEGFASWMGTKAADALHPERRVWLDAGADRERAMALDARRSTHPIQQPVDDERQLGYAFDAITYGKGLGFLRMLEAYLGEAAFRDGIRDYLRQHRYANTTSADLWTALGEAAGKPVAELASDWTLRPGFPRIDVDSNCDAAGRRHVTLRQAPFHSEPPLPAGTARAVDTPVWRVPVALSSSKTDAPTYTLLVTPEAEVTQDGCGAVPMADPDGVGFYRVRYSPVLFAALRDGYAGLPDGGRVKFVADTAALARAGEVPLADYTGLVGQLAAEPRYPVWSGVLADLQGADRLLDGTPAQAAWRRWAIGLLRPRYDALGWDERADDDADARRLRDRLATTLADLGDAGLVADARERFHRFVADPASLRAFEAARVVAIVGRHADAADYRSLCRLADGAAGTAEKQRYYEALESVRDPALAAESMQLALRSDLPPYVVDRALEHIAAAGHADAAWAFAVAHADELLKSRDEPWLQNAAFTAVAAESARPALADEMLVFSRQRLAPATLPQAQRDAAVLLERAAFRARLLDQVDAALAATR